MVKAMDGSVEPLVLVTAADANFAMPMCVAVKSALSHIPAARRVILYVLDDGIGEEDRVRVLDILAKSRSGLEIRWEVPDLSLIKGLVKPVWHTRTTYLRFLIQYLVPEEHERVLYIDSDVVVCDDVSKLWEMEIDPYPFWAVANYAPSRFADNLTSVRDLLEPAPAGALYCNAGIMLMNMPRWREMELSKKAIDFLLTHGEKITLGDQDGLNGVLKGGWGLLDPRWNVQMLTVDRLGQDLFDADRARQLQREVLSDPAIVHYTGPYKPWNLRYRGPRDDVFHRAYLSTGWKNPLLARMEVAVWTAAHRIWLTLHKTKTAISGH